MNQCNYKFKLGIESPKIRGIDDPRPWDLEKIILEQCDQNKTLLDIGCGTAFKIIPFCSKLRFVIGLEPNPTLLEQANKNMLDRKINNILLVRGHSDKLPFLENQFDLITVMLAPCNAAEIYRVLKPGGTAIVERVGDKDKWAIKKMFGKDKQGWRGYLYSDDEGTPRQDSIISSFNKFFSSLSVKNGFWNTYYSLENLIRLIEETPFIRNFDKQLDKPILDKIVNTFTTSKGIEVTQNRILIIAKK